MMDTITTLINDAANHCTQIAKAQKHAIGRTQYNQIIRDTKRLFYERACALGIICFPNKEQGTKPDQFGSLLGKELARRRRIKMIKKQSSLYADPMPEQPNKKQPPPRGSIFRYQQLELFNTRQWIYH